MGFQAAEHRVSWLCETQADRERVLDMEQRLKPLRAWSFGVLAVALLICGPWVGWWTLIPLAVAGMVFVLTDRGLQASPHPEYRLAVVPEDVVHPGLLGGWVVSKPPVPRRTPDEVAR
jgi:hypothetical protein